MLKKTTDKPVVTAQLNLHRLFVLRNISVAAQSAVVLLAAFGLGIRLPLLSLVTVIAFLALLNGLTWARLRQPRPVTSGEFFAHITLDVLALSALLYLAGGSTNPFVSLYLVPLVIVAATLPGRYAWGMAALTALCYTLLMHFYVSLPSPGKRIVADFDLHVFGMWFGFLLAAFLIVLFVGKMAGTLRERDRILARIREQALRDEHLVALGTLAAGAAHELGTPLATMAVLTREIERDHADMPELLEKTRILRAQVDRCKDTLSIMSARAGHLRADGGRRCTVDRYLEDVLTRWRAMRPGVVVSCRWEGTWPAPSIVADATLSQAFINILNNAADASSQAIEVAGRWDAQELVFEVRDRGRGLDPGARSCVGRPFYTTKAQGRGLGLFLARAVIDRLDGSVQLSDRPGGGTSARVALSLASLLAPA